MTKQDKIALGVVTFILLFGVGFLIYWFLFCSCGNSKKVENSISEIEINKLNQNSFVPKKENNSTIKTIIKKDINKTEKNSSLIDNSEEIDNNISLETGTTTNFDGETESIIQNHSFEKYLNQYHFIFDNLELIRDNRNLKIKFLRDLDLNRSRISWMLKIQFKDGNNNFIVTKDMETPVIINVNNFDNTLLLYKYKNSINFKYNRYVLDLDNKALVKGFFNNLDELKDRLQGFIVQGFTDDVGSEEFNLVLSMSRATILNSELKKYSDNIVNLGYGKKRNLVPNSSEKNREINRRIEIIVIYR